MFWLFCNSALCRVVEFYTGNDKTDITCPACGRKGDTEGY